MRAASAAARESRLIVVGGGVGPAATVRLQEHIVRHTLSERGDASHLTVLSVSRPAEIVDRTQFLLGQAPEDARNPGEAMFDGVRAMHAAVEMLGAEAVVGVPCNTFHAPDIWNPFADGVAELKGARLVHMIDETMAMLQRQLPDGGRVGVLSTLGSRLVGVHLPALQRCGFETLRPDDEQAEELNEAILGLKADSEDARAIAVVRRVASEMREGGGCSVLLLGCTELPFALPGTEFEGCTLVDPMVALARALIREVDPSKLRELTSFREAV